jgi:oligoendopeptidase F
VTDAPTPLPSWDLSALYGSIDDPALARDTEALLERARQFGREYRGRICQPDLSAAKLLAAVQEYEEVHRLAGRARRYAALVYAADASDPRHGALVQRLREWGSALRNETLFFELELGTLPDEAFGRLAAEPLLQPYRHHLESERRFRPYQLSEAEEKVLEEKANSGARAWRRLFDETLANTTFAVRVRGEERRLAEAEVLALLQDPDRETRREAAAGLTAGLQTLGRVLGLGFNTLLLDKWTDDRLRGLPYPDASRHLSDELDREVVERVMEVCEQGYPVVADYYRLKGRLLGIEPLADYDRYAPLPKETATIPYHQARDIVLTAFGEYDPRIHAAAEGFFREGRIDAALRPGKQGGAFCSSIDHELLPYVLLNYTERPRDVMTLAHELGHGVHGCLAQRQSYLNYRSSLPLAETASVFAEMLVFERLMRQLPSDQERLALVCEKIEDTFATTFRQVALYRFEQQVHRARREEGELPLERINGLWQSVNQAMFGDSLVLGEDHAWWWLYISHFVHVPFYVYAYAVGELLVLSLFARYRQEGAAFVPGYLEFLAAGGSRRPEELLGDLGIDLRRRDFWEGGLALIRDRVRQAHDLAGRVGK